MPELAAAGWRRWGRTGRAALVIAALLAVAFLVWLLFARGGGSFSYDGPEAPPFEISWGSDLEQVEPETGELLRLASPAKSPGATDLPPEALAVRPLPQAAIPDAAEEDPLPALAVYAARASWDLGAGRSRIVLEGRTELAVDRGPEAYQVAAVAPAGDGSIVIGKRFLVPDPDRPGAGVEIEIAQVTDDSRVTEKVREMPAGFFLNWPIQLLLEDAASVRTAEGLEEPLRSFAFG